MAAPLLSSAVGCSRTGAREGGAWVPVPAPGPLPQRCSGGPGLTPAWVSPAVRRPQDGAFFKGPPYPGYPFLMIPDLSSPYLPNGPLSPGGARTVSACTAAPGLVDRGGPRDAPPGLGDGVGDGAVRCGSWAELAHGVELLWRSRVRLRWAVPG